MVAQDLRVKFTALRGYIVVRMGLLKTIVLFPEHDTMVILNGGYYTDREPVNEIVTEFILPALAQGP